MTTATEQAPSRPDVRAALIDAATRLLRERGVRALTTREVAREAGCSDSALYVHFTDKAHLLASVCERWLPDLTAAIGRLVDRVGSDTVRENLESLAVIALRVYRDMVPTSYAIAGDPELLVHHRDALRAAGRGPRNGVTAIAAYIAAEQRVGRVRPDTDTTVAAAVLLGSCWQRAAIAHYFGEDIIPIDDATFASQLATLLMHGLEPGGET